MAGETPVPLGVEDIGTETLPPRIASEGAAEAPNLRYRSSMEDAMIMTEIKGGRFYGIYDGHGGREVAEYAQNRLHHKFQAGLQNGLPPEQAFIEAYLSIDEEVEETTRAGATAVNVFIKGDEIFFANAGDAKAVIARGEDVIVLTKDHKVANEEDRLRKAGARVASGRILIPGGNINVARALGDSDFEAVIPDPHTGKETLTDEDTDLILACDGLWDVITPKEAVKIARQYKTAQEAAKALVEAALKEGSTDNISVQVIKFGGNAEGNTETTNTGGTFEGEGSNSGEEPESNPKHRREELEDSLPWEDFSSERSVLPSEQEIQARRLFYESYRERVQDLTETYGGSKGKVKLPDGETREEWARTMLPLGREIYELVEKTRLGGDKSLEGQLAQLPNEAFFILYFSEARDFKSAADLIAFYHALEGAQKWLLYLGYAKKKGEPVSLSGFAKFIKDDSDDKPRFDEAGFNKVGINRSEQWWQFDTKLVEWRSKGYLDRESAHRMRRAQELKEEVERRLVGKGKVRWYLEKAWLSSKDVLRTLVRLDPSEEERWMVDWTPEERTHYLNRVYAKILDEIGEEVAARQSRGEQALALDREEVAQARQQEELIDQAPQMLRMLGEMLIKMSGDLNEGDLERLLRNAMGGELPLWGQEVARSVSRRVGGVPRNALGIISILLMIFGVIFMTMGGERRRR